ncbi:MAG: hypothetical protein WC378_15825 [Opitutaceae bacterium]|jgi:DNA-binding beta-propeller fold protein YncE
MPAPTLRLLLSIGLSALSLSAAETAAPPSPRLRLVNTIPLPKVEGPIGGIAFDQPRRHLLVAATGNNTVEVVEVNTGRLIQSIPGLHEPQGIAFARDLNRFAAANRKEGSIALYDANTLDLLSSVPLAGSVDIVRYDSKPHILWVGYSKDPGFLVAVDLQEMQDIGRVKLEGCPALFQFETGGPFLYVIIPKAGHIAVVDRNRCNIAAKWPIASVSDFHSMALDEIGHRLFIAGRNPSKLLVLNTKTGGLVASLDITGDADDMFFDPVLRRLLVIGGEGSITMIAMETADTYRVLETIPTARGARAACYLGTARQLYLAVPHDGDQQAEIRVFSLSAGGVR